MVLACTAASTLDASNTSFIIVMNSIMEKDRKKESYKDEDETAQGREICDKKR